MITWAGLAGKLIEFLATKLLGKKLDVALDERKRACRAFLRLHDALYDLEHLTLRVVGILDRVAVAGKPRLYSAWFRGLQDEIKASTSTFIDAAAEVSQVLEVLDPALLLAFGSVHASKGGLIAAASKVFSGQVAQFDVECQASSDRLRRISYTVPPKSLMTLDLEELYKSMADKPLPRGMLGGSSDTLARRLPQKNPVERLTPIDVSGIQGLSALLSNHLVLVGRAREKLRELIATKFSIEDLLYVGSKKTA